MKTNYTLSIIYNLLVKTYKFRKISFFYKIWRFFWDLSSNFKNKFIKTKLHGFDAILPIGHLYLLYIQNYKNFNHPLISIVKCILGNKKTKLTIVDVGSAVGDTVLLLESLFPNKNTYICIDGDLEFNQIINNNLKFLGNRFKFINSLVSNKTEKIGKIVKPNPTTGSSLSEELQDADSLDNLLKDIKSIDIIKIDVDGYDGLVILGASSILKKLSPAIIFEWSVPHFKKTNNNIYIPFEELSKAGYKHFYWFDNFGNFLFYRIGYDKNEIEFMGSYSEELLEKRGYHYDIIALKESSDLLTYLI